MQPMTDDEGRGSALKRYGPMLAILVVVAVVAAVLALSGGDDEEDDGGTATGADASDVPEGAISWQVAEDEGITDEVEWGDRCDTALGVLKLPSVPRVPCYAQFDGDNGGATSLGVTGDTIKIAYYVYNADDPLLQIVFNVINNTDTTEQIEQTGLRSAEMLTHYFESYGRTIELVPYRSQATSADEVAAIADAEAIARDIQPFAVLGGPQLTNAFADTLSARGIVCIFCAPPQPSEWYVDHAPYVWDVLKNTEQSEQMAAEYIGSRLAGRNAIHAGDEAFHDQERVFGYVHLLSSDESRNLQEAFTNRLRDEYQVEWATIETFDSPVTLSGTSRDIISKLKDAGVTTVVYSGDPVAPGILTRTATEQGYFPEWVITGSSLVDTTAFSRSYDQEQWSHAFGPSNLYARVPREQQGGYYLYKWYFGEEAPAPTSVQVLLPAFQFLYSAIQGAGPNLTPETFQQSLFSTPVVPSTPTTPQISWGDHGFWDLPDYTAIDDQTEVWWDPDATGPSEAGAEGSGMWVYVDGGRRYLPGQWPDTDPAVFQAEGGVTLLDGLDPQYEVPASWVPITD